jgi:hypothetical protein
MKVCARCKVEKPLEDFAKSACKKDGRTYSCKACLEIGRKERLAADPERAARLREADAARKRAKADEIYQKIQTRKESDLAYAERLKSYSAKYAEKNRLKELARGKEYRQTTTSRSESREAYNEYMREWRRENSARINEKNREKRKANPELAKLDNERRRASHNPLASRNSMLMNNYGITLEDYLARYEDQGGKCAICGDSKPDCGKDGLVVDHCHDKGNVRRLLCTHCNKGLGHFRDDIHRLSNAIEYLKLFTE